MTATWRKLENENGFPFYLNELNNYKQWDHPKFSDIKQRLDECNYIKYASYRVASKFRVLQQALFTDEVPLEIISGVFERHRLGATESSLCLESYDMEAVLSDIYFAANKRNHTNVDVDFASELTMNFLYNIFDKDRKSNIDVSSTKLTLALLSKCKLFDLYRFIFTSCSDHNNCITRLRLQSLLTKICNVISYLNEGMNFGMQLIGAAMDQCFSNNPGLVGVNECTFITWLESVPQLFSWLPIMQRFRISETVVHNYKCSMCKISPVIGMRYKCVKCSRYVQCQKCFLMGRVNQSHKLTHAMKEYCREGSTGSFSKGIKKKLKRLIKCAYVVNENCISDVNIVKTKPISSIGKDLILKEPNTEETCAVQPLSSPLSQLQVVIRQLELQNKELQNVMKHSTTSNKDIKQYLEQHRLHVATQIQKLKVLKDHMNTTSELAAHNPLESTPMVSSIKPPTRGLVALDLFSPISQIEELSIQDSFPNKTCESGEQTQNYSLTPYSIQDISTWIGGQPSISNLDYQHIISENMDSIQPANSELDDALVKLQQILANNFSLDESLGAVDNCQLKTAVTEVEGMLSSIIDNVECNKVSVSTKNVAKDKDYFSENYSVFGTS